MRRIGVVVKYYPPLERVSGIIGFLRVLNRALADRCELHVITSRPWGEESLLTLDGHSVHRCAGVFPIAAGRKAQQLDLDGLIFVSGIYDQRKAPPYIEAFSRSFRKPSTPRVFLQATHVDGRSNRLFAGALSRFDAVLATSTSLRAELTAQLDRPVDLLLPGVELPDLRSPSTPITIGFINHLNAVKGADVALAAIDDALSRHDAVRAIIAGTGDFEDDARRRFSDHDRVDLLGFLDEGPLFEALESCDVMLLPFRTGVSVLGVSQTVLEVMASAHVVIGTDVPPIAEAVEDGVTGLLSPIGEVSDILNSLIEDDGRRLAIGRAARADVERRWNIEDRVLSILGQFDALID